MTSPLFNDLLTIGLKPNDAQTIDDEYSVQPEFLDGLEQIAQFLAMREKPSAIPPNGEPWKSIYLAMAIELSNGGDHDSAWRAAINCYPVSIQFALTSVLNIKMQVILNLQGKSSKKRKTKDHIQGLRNLGYDFRLNLCGYVIEVNDAPITDGLMKTISNSMHDAGFRRLDTEYAWGELAYKNQYHPVKNYLSNLSYDGGNYIEKLSTYFTDNTGMFHVWLRKWLIGCVQKVYDSYKFNPMLVLEGPQNIGKSLFTQWLASPLHEYHHEGSIRPEDKDCRLLLSKTWIWEVSELGATTRRQDVEELKQFISMAIIEDRPPYAHYPVRLPAMASLIGTVNNSSGIYSDATGSRRFLTSEIPSIDWEGYTKDLKPDQIWSEAMAAYLSGESNKLTPEEEIKSREINEMYDIEEPVEGAIKKFFRIEPHNMMTWTSSADILVVLEDPTRGAIKGNTKSTSMFLSNVMKRNGVRKCKRDNIYGQLVWGYLGVSILP